MRCFVVKITAEIPYPIKRSYMERASNIGTAANRALKKYFNEERVKEGKRAKKVTITIIK